MDYHSLPRKQLQALCKKHGIPANAANSEMADALTALLKPKPQLHVENSKQPEKRATRSREPALSGAVSKSEDVEEDSNMKLQKANNGHKILEEDSNRKPQRVTRGRGNASAVSEAPKPAALKTEKMPTNGETEAKTNKEQVAKQVAKKVSTRNAASKQSNSQMPTTNAEETVDSKVVSPNSNRKKEKAGGIVLRRGRVKVRSPRNHSKSPESAKIIEEVAETTKEQGVGVPCSQSCLVDAKRTRKKKRSVTFSDVLEIKCASIEDPTRGCVSEDIEEQPASETMAEIQQGTDFSLPKNINSACMAKKAIVTRKASRTVSTHAIAQTDHQKPSKESVAKVSRAGLHTFDAEKTANVEMGGKSDRRRAVRGTKMSNSVGKVAAKENEVVKVVDSFVKGELIEDVPCTRRSRRLTIAPTDVKPEHDKQLPTEQPKGQSIEHHEGLSIAPKKTEGDLPAETSRRSRRKTLAPLELNQVQSSVGSAPAQMEKKVSKAEDTQSKNLTTELKDEALESQQKLSKVKVQDSIPIANKAGIQPIKMKEAPAEPSRRNRRAPLELKQVQSSAGSASAPMEKKVSKPEDTQSKNLTTELKGEALDSQQRHSEVKLCDSIPIANEAVMQPIKMKEALSARSLGGSRQKALVPSTDQCISSAEVVSNEIGYQNICSTEMEKKVDTNELEKIPSKAALSTSILANSEPDSLQEVTNDGKSKVETAKAMSVMQMSIRKTSAVSIEPDYGTAVSPDPAFDSQTNRAKQKGFVIVDKAVGKNLQDSEDSEVIAQAHNEQSQENLALKHTNVLGVEDPVSSTPSNEDIIHNNGFSCAFQIVMGEGGDGQNQISEDANSISCNEELEYDGYSVDVRSPTMTAIHCAASDTSPLVVATDSIKPISTAAVKDQSTEATSIATSPECVLLSATSPDCLISRHKASIEKNHSVIMQEGHAASPECVLSGHKFSFGKDHDVIEQEGQSTSPKCVLSSATSSGCVSRHEMDHDVIEQKGHSVDESATIKSSTKDGKASSNSPVATIIQDNGSLDSNHQMNGIDLENSIEIHTDKDITASSPAAIVESIFELKISKDIATAERKACTFKVQSLTSDEVKFANMTPGGAAHLIEQQPVDLNMCEEDPADKEGKEQLQDRNNRVAYHGVKSVDDTQLSCSLERGIGLPRESACKTEQRCPRSIYKSARKAKFSVPWENMSLEETIAPHPNQEASLDSLDQAEKDAEIWGSNDHEMTCDEVDSASSADEESSAETEETISDTEVCNFDTEMLSSYTEGDYSCSEDDTPSDSEKDTMFDSENEDYFSEIEGELLSGDECYESQEQETSEEESAESEDDAAEDFEEYEVSPVPQAAVAMSESIDALYITHDWEDQQVEIIAASKSSLANDGVKQAEIINHLALENDTHGCAPSVEPTNVAGKAGGQHKELQKTLSMHAVNEIQENVDALKTYHDHTVIDRVQSANDSTCQDSDSLVSFISTPLSKVNEDSIAGPAIVDRWVTSTMLDNVERSQLLESNSKNTFISASELPCLGHYELILQNIGAEMGDPAICNEVNNVQEVQKGPGEFCGLVDEAGNLEVKNEVENEEGSVGMAPDVQEGSEDLKELLDLGEGTTSELTEELIITEVATFAANDKVNEKETATEQDLQILHLDNGFNVDDLSQKQNNEGALAYDTTHIEMGTTGSEDLKELLDLGEGTTSELTEELMITEVATFGSSTHAANDEVNKKETATEQDLQMGTPGSEDLKELLDLGEGTTSELTEEPMITEVATFGFSTLAANDEVKEKESATEQDLPIGTTGSDDLKELLDLGEGTTSELIADLMITGAATLGFSLLAASEKVNEKETATEQDLQMGTTGSEDLNELLGLGEGTTSELTEELMIIEVATFGSSTLAANDEVNEKETATEQDLQMGITNSVDLGEGTTSELTEEIMITEVATLGSSTLGANDKVNEKETATEQDVQFLHLDNDFSAQKQSNEGALSFDTTYIEMDSTGSVVPDLDIVTDDDKIHLFSFGTSCNLVEEGETLLEHECEQDSLPSDASKQSKTEDSGEQPGAIQSESIAESLVSQVMDSNSFEVDQCSTPKQSDDLEIAPVFIHEILNEAAQTMPYVEIESMNAAEEEVDAKNLAESSNNFEVDQCTTPKRADDLEILPLFLHEVLLNEVAQTMHCVETESINAEVEEVHEKNLNASQLCEEVKETAAGHEMISEISKEQSLKQIDLTLSSLRELRQMCKGNLMSAKKKTENDTKKKTENETLARTPSKSWMSATKQVHQTNTSMHPRDFPSANKRSALKALSSNIKATPSAAMHTPTAKGSQRPQNLMSTYDANDGAGKHLVTPSPQAPMSTKRDFARSHHR